MHVGDEGRSVMADQGPRITMLLFASADAVMDEMRVSQDPSS